MGGIYEVYHGNGFRWYDVYSELHEDRCRHSEVVRGGIHTYRRVISKASF
jgi:hypothetical protein